MPQFLKIIAKHYIGEMATREFDILALNGSNFPNWTMDVKVNLPTIGLYICIDEPTNEASNPSNMSMFSYLICNKESHPSGFENGVMLKEDSRFCGCLSHCAMNTIINCTLLGN